MVGTIQRNSNTIVKPVTSVTKVELVRFLADSIQPGTFVFIEEHRSYTGLSDEYEYAVVSHRTGEYVHSIVLNNSAESF